MIETSLHTNWSFPTEIRIGRGRISELSEACRSMGMTRPLLVTDPGLVNLPMVKASIASNDADGLPTGLFSDLKPNPISRNVLSGVKIFQAEKYDGVIAFGGGSAMDVGKLIAFISAQTRQIWDFEDIDDNWTNANVRDIAPIVAVPTTSGTGSEVGRAAVVTNESINTKKVIFHPRMMPGIVICDPELVVGLPSNLTAWTGMDALVHCLEAYCAKGYHPAAEGIALEGLVLIKRWLPRAVADGTDIEARTHMMAAAAMGAIAFQKGLGAIHALSHPVGAIYGTHHGLTNAVFMPYVLNFNKPAIADKLEVIAKRLNLPSPSFKAFIDWSLQLREEFNIVHTALELGVDCNHMDKLANMAATDPAAASNPIPLDVSNIGLIYKAALNGIL